MDVVAGLGYIALDALEATTGSADEGEDEVVSDEEIEGQDNATATKKYVPSSSFSLTWRSTLYQRRSGPVADSRCRY